MEFYVSLDKFEGPLDLMLHLIHEKQLDLFNLDINALCTQYVDYIHQAEELHLEIAGEYLSELAGLIEIKSKSLLPKKVNIEEEEEDPKEKLIKRLIEYQKFKDIAAVFASLQQERSLHLSKPITVIETPGIDEVDISEIEGNPYDLMKAMSRCLRHMALSTVKEAVYRPKEYSVTEVSEDLKTRFKGVKEEIRLEQMLDGSESVMKAIAVFLAVLDLIHQQELLYRIDENEEIYLKWSEKKDE